MEMHWGLEGGPLQEQACPPELCSWCKCEQLRPFLSTLSISTNHPKRCYGRLAACGYSCYLQVNKDLLNVCFVPGPVLGPRVAQ